ncbi:long-chain fatty acid--CoA ligase [Subsaximicrobium wynnwilliamsii]|uniref:Long-chain fatty acid--CoA ligase n=1 Tax=Subsaximicrobium wynnwilliamsii TaxID=291179 RepID=A0A5C6ZPM4_9FLAO|nr:long-chain fatty acid--CoA ligase [Subsaximicrobium wynnwilliamsii]TXD85249.1 long-chain fatty acid--CoA ligase [Subsaximicrobium wynnwilliamsii]TXD91291.1 long-chain fatty acid--CoA ligase [Subsaximicrobium wynnwilliamsii]TXE04685.1 long-chain fatty acid--CoA ligase [Subsaximicrobium wynnwilliamsii]
MTRLFDLLDYQLKNNPLEASISGRNKDGNWESYSTQKLKDTAEQAAAGLLKLGLVPGDKVAIVAYKNRPEWVVMDYAVQLAGMISIPLYPTISVLEYEYILNEAEVKAVFCGGLDLYDKLSKSQKEVATLKHIYTFDGLNGNPYWEAIFDTNGISSLESIKSNIKGDDLVTIIYTSGTTGRPKGVMLSHANVMHVVTATAKLLVAGPNEKVLSFLPLCHIYERAVSFCYCYKGVSVFLCGTDNLSGPDGDLAAVGPVAFTTVPRLLEKIYEAIYNKGLALEGTKRKLFFWALDLTDDYELDQQLSFVEKLKWKLADTLIFSKWRAALGGNIKQIVTGAAPCPVKILRVFCAAGIPIREAYGLTETSPTLTANSLEPNAAMIGTVGYAIDGVELYIDKTSGEYKEDEGEILAHGPNVMLGYYKKPEINEQVFQTIDGKKWFCTGDIGKLIKGVDGREFLKITDRKKELLKTSGGKYVAPAPIETRIKEDFLVEQMMVIGDKQKFISALILPSEEALKNWCLHKKMEWTSLAEMIQHEKVIKKYQKVIDSYNPEFGHIEQIKKFKLIATPWLPIHEDGALAELTPTLKLKRRVIREKYSAEIAAIYAKE